MGLRVADEVKQPDEERRYGINFSVSGALATGDTVDIDNTTAKIYDAAGVDMSSTMIKAGSLQLLDGVVSVMVTDGENGAEYKLTFLVATNYGEILEEDIVIPVEAL